MVWKTFYSIKHILLVWMHDYDMKHTCCYESSSTVWSIPNGVNLEVKPKTHYKWCEICLLRVKTDFSGNLTCLMLWWCDFYLFLQKQQPAHRYIPIGYFPPGIKESTCDDATIKCLMVLRWFSPPFGWRGGALSTSPFNHPQCPFTQMTDTDVTFLPNYHNMDPARLYVMILTSPPSLPRSRL